MENQHKSILNHLKFKGSLTPLEALNLYGCLRLAAVVFRLKSRGHIVRTELINKNRKTFSKYYYEGNVVNEK